jgi:hypothetical protein
MATVDKCVRLSSETFNLLRVRMETIIEAFEADSRCNAWLLAKIEEAASRTRSSIEAATHSKMQEICDCRDMQAIVKELHATCEAALKSQAPMAIARLYTV